MGFFSPKLNLKCSYVSLKFTGEVFVMTMKKDVKLDKKLTFRFKIDMRTLMSFDPSTRKSQKFALQWAAFDQNT